ncbi:ABC transporter ATP-binding protein [Fonticella tunisiensis]|uniref:Putative ABC transport system ATP-binding protein n=1 Tax=Fonticella tunisiensis TaxID=1096341 RepID=A0A4R7KS85_9CLOT|nr:ATP-binding cassette domain-containing protein [Fonticella tunisiensis]TDT60952.1 putative ABC transport system ATP-binding protein [Fonticella tunisiensis]
MNILYLEKVSYQRENKTILKNVNLTVNESDFIIVTGPSGSGKSTLLKLLNNLISPTKGRIVYRGKSMEEYNPVELRQNISLCFQTPYLFGRTVFENMVFPFNIRRKNIDKSMIHSLLKNLDLKEEILHKDIKNLSGGEKQRVSLARTLLFKPDILLLDEITSALDEENTLKVENIITKLNNEGVTIIWVTHNKEQAERLGTRRIHIAGGTVSEVKA